MNNTNVNIENVVGKLNIVVDINRSTIRDIDYKCQLIQRHLNALPGKLYGLPDIKVRWLCDICLDSYIRILDSHNYYLEPYIQTLDNIIEANL